jgi:hypothetical protein
MIGGNHRLDDDVHIGEFSFEAYQRYTKLKNLILGQDPKYPYTLNSDVKFTQNEITLKYKQNYKIDDSKPNTEKNDKDGGKTPSNIDVVYF